MPRLRFTTSRWMRLVFCVAVILWAIPLARRSAAYHRRATSLRSFQSALLRRAEQLEASAAYTARMSRWPGLPRSESSKWAGSAIESRQLALFLRTIARRQDRPVLRLRYAATHPWVDLSAIPRESARGQRSAEAPKSGQGRPEDARSGRTAPG